ncbi:Beta-1,4-N-acetylgalactosaminyltransferase bre-4 [Hypsibius exemplaris]|uniref:Beta-1,4-N-acetylgalactosaminyltransferase n=1 Tax=Hypsibius exemplaris TaxID=2072580 RepID=A0A9X6NC93_HYPEX|nr:Beta-1,4-N-acetylgalactosaminyltransferase bre-4 [Hypsibius exemplaris]
MTYSLIPASSSFAPAGAFAGFCRAHIYRGLLVCLSCLVLFEFSSMVFSEERRIWMPAYPGFLKGWNLKMLEPRVLSCNETGCYDQFGSLLNLEAVEFLRDIPGNSSAAAAAAAAANGTLLAVTGMELCPAIPPALVGAVKVLTEKLSDDEIMAANQDLGPGGRFRPPGCVARHKVAIILPFRDRTEHLRIFLNNIHPILRRQQLDYGIFVVEQIGITKFNRGTLMNVGYVEAKKSYDYDCFIFHDVDLLPENDRNMYSCPNQPRHMSVAIDKFSYHLPYNTILGGVSAFTDAQFARINGFPNIYWGWGGEDDDLSLRVRSSGYNISRYPAALARYKMIKHDSDPSNPANPIRFDLLRAAAKRFTTDGLSNLQYKIIDSQLRPLYTWLLVDIGTPPAG